MRLGLLTGTHGPRLSQRASAALQPPALDRGSEGVEMVSSRQPPPESLPSAAISELTEPLEQPLSPLMTTEGPFTQGSGREEGSPCQSLSEPNPGLWPQDPKVAQHGDSSEGGKKKKRQGPPWPLSRAQLCWKTPAHLLLHQDQLGQPAGRGQSSPFPCSQAFPGQKEVCGWMNNLRKQFSKLH